MMKLTIVQTGGIPERLRADFAPYPAMFETMFARSGARYDFETVPIYDGAGLPDPGTLEAVLITGSAAGVYDDLPWMDPLRAFIRNAYAHKTPMVGICFGHQIMADALGGDVRKSEKGWGLGRHVYHVRSDGAPRTVAVACSHQDQVIVPPPDAEVILSSEFTPNAGLRYLNGAAISFQPHPEFTDDYTHALIELRRGNAPETVLDTAVASLTTPSQSDEIVRDITAFLQSANAS